MPKNNNTVVVIKQLSRHNLRGHRKLVKSGKKSKVLGVVSGKPAIVADTDWNRWAHKYLYDEFNRYLLG